MDGWRDVLLEWANSTELLKRQYQKLNKIDINAFFGEFRRLIKSPIDVHQNNVAADAVDLRSFIKAIYPDYNASASTSDARNDLVHRWSLLLHYSCLKSPMPDIQKKCSALSAGTQEKLTKFFTFLLGQPLIDRTQLNAAIAEAIAGATLVHSPAAANGSGSCSEGVDDVSPLRVLGRRRTATAGVGDMPLSALSSPSVSCSMRSGGVTGISGTGSSIQSPVSGNQRMPSDTSTPRTKMLDDYNWENRQLRAQIDAERDERVFLEAQLKQSELKIEKLVQDRKTLTHDNHELKNQLLTVDTENVSPNRNHKDEQVKRRLRKDIADRDRRIEELTTNIERQQDANAALRLKITCFETQLNNQEERSRELLALVEEQRTAMDEREGQLGELRSTNREMSLYMQELRRNAAGGGGGSCAPGGCMPLPPGVDIDGLDLSVDYLDASQNGGGGSGGGPNVTSPRTPDNLGGTVIDVRLREEQVRTQQLQAQLAKLADDHARAIDELHTRHASELGSVSAELRDVRATNERLSSTCQLEHVERIRQLGDAMQTLQREHEEAARQRQRDQEATRAEAAELLDHVTRLNALNQDLLLQIGEREVRIDALGKDTSELMERREELSAELESVRQCVAELRDNVAEHERVRTALRLEEEKLRDTARGLQTKVDMLEAARTTKHEDSEMTQRQLERVEQTLQELRPELQRANAKVEQVTEENGRLTRSQDELRVAFKDADKVRIGLEAEMDSLKTFNEDKIRENAKLQANCEKLRDQLLTAQATLSRLERENADYRTEHEAIHDRTKQMTAAAALFDFSIAQMQKDVIDLNEKNRSLRSQLDAKLDRIQTLQQSENDLTRSLSDTQTQAQLDRTEIDALKQANADAFQMNRNLSEERETLLARTAELGKLLIDQKAGFAETDAAMRQKIVESENALAELRSELVQITVSLSGEAADIERLKEENRRIQEARDKVRADLTHMTETVAQLEMRNAELDCAVAQQTEKLADAERSLASSRDEHTAVEATLKDLQEQHLRVSDHIVELSATNTRLTEQYREQQEICARLRDELAQSLEVNGTLAANLKRIESESQTHLHELEHRLKGSIEDCSTRSSQVQTLAETIAELTIEKDALVERHTASVRNASIAMAELEERLADKESELGILSRQAAEVRERRSSLETLYEQLQEQHREDIGRLTAERQALEHRMAEQQTVCQQHSQEIMELSDGVRNMKAERASIDEAHAALERNWKEATKELEAKLLNIEVSCLDKVRQIERLQTERIELTRNCEQLEEQRVATEKAGVVLAEQMRDECAAHKARIAELCQELDEKRAELETHDAFTRKLDQELNETRRRCDELEAESAALMRSHADAVRELQEQSHKKRTDMLAQFDEVKRLVGDMDAVRADRKQFEQRCSELAAELERSHKTCDRLETDIRCGTEAHSLTVQTLEQLRQQQLDEQNENRRQVAALDEQLAAGQNERDRLDAQCAELTQQVTQLNMKVNQLSKGDEEMAALRDKLKDSEDTCCEQINEVKRLSRALEAERTLRSETEERSGELNASIASATAELRTQMQEVSKLMLTVEQLRSERDALLEQIAQQTGENQAVLGRVQCELQQQQQLCAERDAQLDALRAEIATLQQQSDETAAELRRERDEFASKRQQLTEEIAARQTERDESAALVRRMENEIGELRHAHTTIELERGRLVVEHDDIAVKARDDSKRLVAALAEIAGKNTELEKQRTLLDEQRAEAAAMRRQINESTERMAQLKAEHLHQIDAVLMDKTEFEVMCDVLNMKGKELDEKLKASEVDKVRLTETCEKLNADLADLNDKFAIAERELCVSEAEVTRAKTVKCSMDESLAAFEQKIRVLEEEKDRLAKDVAIAMATKERVVELERVAEERAAENAAHQGNWQRVVASVRDILQVDAESDAAADAPAQLDAILTAWRCANAAKQTQQQLDYETALSASTKLESELEAARDELTAAQLRCDAVEHQYRLDQAATQQRLERAESGDRQRLNELELELSTARQTAAVLQQQYDTVRKADTEQKESLAIFRSKLMKERETVAEMRHNVVLQRDEYEERLRVSEQRVTDTRAELEGKLEKMKGRMRALYNEESAKVKARHDTELADLSKRHGERHAEQLKGFEAQVHRLSSQIFKLNDQSLVLRQQNEQLRQRLLLTGGGGIMRPSLGLGGGGSSIGGRDSRVMPASSMSSLIKMEDEEGEQFTNTYLNDLLSGGPPSSAATSTAGRPSTAAGDFMPSEDFFAGGRDSVPLSELKMRNSMLPRHLRSSYAVQYNDAYSTEDDIKLHGATASLPDESMHSAQSDVRRNTLYKRPGPPTPSKHSARLSVGGTFETAAAAAAPTRDAAKPAKTSPQPSKLRSLFTSSKSSSSATAAAAASAAAAGQHENSPPKRRLSNMFKLK